MSSIKTEEYKRRVEAVQVLYYEAKKSKIEISRLLGLHRSVITRIIEKHTNYNLSEKRALEVIEASKDLSYKLKQLSEKRLEIAAEVVETAQLSLKIQKNLITILNNECKKKLESGSMTVDEIQQILVCLKMAGMSAGSIPNVLSLDAAQQQAAASEQASEDDDKVAQVYLPDNNRDNYACVQFKSEDAVIVESED